MKMQNRQNNPEISVVMPVYNAEKYVKEAIDSIINQSFTDFECIIVDDGSTDKTKEIIRSYDDKRIILVENKHDFIESLNMGMKRAKGKYIARMDADDMMHPDRLKIQYSMMEAEPSITVCGSWMTRYGERVAADNIAQNLAGLIELPLLQFLRGNFVSHPTVMIRKEFLIQNQLQYEDYPCAEDLKLWSEIAKLGGVFYIENQPLLHYRISDFQISKQKREEQQATTERILREILYYLLDKNSGRHPELTTFSKSLLELQEKEFINFAEMLQIVHRILHTNKNRLILA